MRATNIASTVFVALLLGIMPAYAQHGQQGENQGHAGQQHGQAGQQQHSQQQHAQQQHGQAGQQQHSQPAQQQRQQRQAQQSRPGQHQQHAQQQQGRQQQQRGQQAQGRQQQSRGNAQRAQMQRSQGQRHMQEGQQRGAWQQHRANNFDSQHRNWQQRGGYNGFRVPDYYFRAHYGREHYFHVFSLPFLLVGGYPRFQYRGYWFSAMDPYPEYWGPDWYQTDDVYVDYVDNGYYLYNRRYPGRPGVAISISL